MNTTLIELEAKKEMLNEVRVSEKQRLLDSLINLLNSLFVEQCGGHIRRYDIDFDFTDSTEIRFDVCFLNEKGEADFASDMDCRYSTYDNKLHINHGTCGEYTSNDIYLVKRIKLLNYIWENISTIEASLAELCEDCKKLKTVVSWIGDISYEIKQIMAEIRKKKSDEIEKNLIEGIVVVYNNEVSFRNRILPDKPWFDKYEWEVIKVTPKFVTLVNITNNVEYKVRKETLVKEVVNEKIFITVNP